ncbi:hypothetical protein ACLOJK_007326 [Asimina triloba]
MVTRGKSSSPPLILANIVCSFLVAGKAWIGRSGPSTLLPMLACSRCRCPDARLPSVHILPPTMPPSTTACTYVRRCPEATACTARPPSSRLACQQCLPSMLDADVGNTLACRHGHGTTPSTHGDGRHHRIEDSPATMLSNVAYK